jgi:hypothetical protein
MLLSKVREKDLVGNKVADSIIAAEERLDLLIRQRLGKRNTGADQKRHETRQRIYYYRGLRVAKKSCNLKHSTKKSS